jgi:hypothetical protein
MSSSKAICFIPGKSVFHGYYRNPLPCTLLTGLTWKEILVEAGLPGPYFGRLKLKPSEGGVEIRRKRGTGLGGRCRL